MRNQKGFSELTTLWFFAAGIIVLVGGLVLLISFVDLGIASFVRPASTAIDNKTFKESQQYNDGMARRISEFKRDYEQAIDPASKASIKAAVQVELSSYDISRLPSQLQPFAYSMLN
jgi:hypothetical protein